jgi:hypothetical protein
MKVNVQFFKTPARISEKNKWAREGRAVGVDIDSGELTTFLERLKSKCDEAGGDYCVIVTNKDKAVITVITGRKKPE